jgi:hypothetical protein
MKSLKKYFFLILLLPVNLNAQNDEVCKIQKASHWQQQFDDHENELFTLANTQMSYLEFADFCSNSPFGIDKYNLANYIDAYATMYDATNDNKYVDIAIGLIINVMDSATILNTNPVLQSTYHVDDNPQNFYQGWIYGDGCQVGPDCNYFDEGVLDEVYLFRYVTKLLRLMKKNGLQTTRLYYTQYHDILEFTETHIWDKWYKRCYENTPQRWVYLETTHMASHWAYLGLNLYYLSAQNNCQYIEVFNNISHKGFPHKTSINDNPLYNIKGASLRGQDDFDSILYQNFSWKNFTWDQIADVNTIKEYKQDVSHANAVVALIDESNLLGMHWNREDIGDLIKFTKNKVLTYNPIGFTDNFLLNNEVCPNQPPETIPPTIYAYPLCYGEEHTGKFQSDGFIKLGKYDCELQKAYEIHLSIMVSYLPHLSTLNTYAQLCLNAKYLEEELLQTTDNVFSNHFFPVNTSHYSIKAGNYQTVGNTNEITIINHKDKIIKANVLNFENQTNSISIESQWWSSLNTNTDFKYKNVIETVSGDFDGDGADDMAFFYKNGITLELRVIYSNGSDSFGISGANVVWSRPIHSLSQPNGIETEKIMGTTLAGNYRGDSKDEIIILYKTDSLNFVYYLFEKQGNGQFNMEPINRNPNFGGFNIDQVKNRITVGDYDADGKDEIATFYDLGNNQTFLFIMKYLPNYAPPLYEYLALTGHTSTTLTSTTINFNANKFTGRVVSGDFFGNNKDDISFLIDEGDGNNKIKTLESYFENYTYKFHIKDTWSNANNSFKAEHFTHKMVAGNFDGVGKDDIVLIKSTTNSELEVMKLISNGIGSFYVDPIFDFATIWVSCTQNLNKNCLTPVSNTNDFSVDDSITQSNINFTIYPNPSDGILNIESETAVNKISVFNLQGHQLFEKQNSNKIDLSHFMNGLYLIKIEDINGNIAVRRLIKK